MVKTYIAAISPDGDHLIVKRNNRHYALVTRSVGITSDTKWGSDKILSQMLGKAEYREVRKGCIYKGNKEGD